MKETTESKTIKVKKGRKKDVLIRQELLFTIKENVSIIHGSQRKKGQPICPS